MKTNAAFKITATVNPRITIDPSNTGKGMTALLFPPFFMPSSTRRNTSEIRKHTLQIKTSLEKKRIRNYFMLQITKNITGHKLLWPAIIHY
jgi:hypothetical protein